MSAITGVADFKDYFEKVGIDEIKKLSIYVGYYNYLDCNPLDMTNYKTVKDWSKFFNYTIKTKSIYPHLGSGYIVLDDRDFLSEQEDKTVSKSTLKKIYKKRDYYQAFLMDMGYTPEEAIDYSRYTYELEEKRI